MLVHKGGKIKNWGGECRDVTPTNCSLKIYLKRALGGGGGSGWRGQGGCERRIEVFAKIQKKNGGGGSGGSRVGGGGGGGWGQGGFERRIKVFVKIENKK